MKTSLHMMFGVLVIVLPSLVIAAPPAPAASGDVADRERKTIELEPYAKGGNVLLPNATGKLVYYPKSKGIFRGAVELLDVSPGKTYVLCLNKKPGSDNESKLPQAYKPANGDEEESYYDFVQVKSDSRGKATVSFEVGFPAKKPFSAGKWECKFFVKQLQGHKVVLYNDNGPEFEVEK